MVNRRDRKSPADFPEFADNNKPLTPASGPSASAPVTPKEQAKKLLAQSRAAFNAGAYDEARTKALKADEVDVKWDILEDQPQTLISEIERATGTKILSRKSLKKRTNTSSTDPGRTQAIELIRQGRADLQIGRFDAARKKALQAKQLNVVFGMFEDRPDTLLADVARAERAAPSGSADPFAFGNETDNTTARSPKETTGSPADAQKAQDLLRQARQDLKAGNLAAARLKADQAAKFHVNYSPFDDRPELVMESISIRESQTNQNAAKDFGVEQAGAESVQGTSDSHVSQADSQSTVGTESATVRKAKKQQALSLVRSAREDLKKGRIELARARPKRLPRSTSPIRSWKTGRNSFLPISIDVILLPRSPARETRRLRTLSTRPLQSQ